jgi:hypothetical protein
MKIVIAAAAVTTSGLIATGVLGVATAETPSAPATGTSPPRTVSVQGVASQQLASEASSTTATSIYRQAMAAAVADGQAKAQFLAEKAGVTLGSIQSLAEGGGYIECPSEVEYTGGQPDFGFATGYGVTATQNRSIASGRPVPFHGKRQTRRKMRPVPKHGSAKKSSAGTCTLSTQVALAYQLG